MSEEISNNKRIAKNTFILYIRMLLSMVVSLYTSRVVLNTLGVEDYGIYGVVGGIVSMFSFLNASMGGATSRFLTFEIGRGDLQKLKETFASALIIHMGIALIIIILAETIGLWFLMNKLVIPDNRIYAAQWVYQLSILSVAVSVTQVPYNASIIAHEKMNIYAYVEIANVMLKLLIVYFLVVGQFDKLIFYAILTLAISIVIAFIYKFYCVKKFKECRFNWILKSDILKPIISFSGWDLYVNLSLTGRTQGVNILLNLFFGPMVNAAVSIGVTIQSVLSGFGENFFVVMKPQIIKKYAIGDFRKMENMMNLSCVLGSLMMGLFSIPLLLDTKYIISLWLGECPLYSDVICRLCLIFAMIYIGFRPVVFVIHAIGCVKWMGLIDGTLYLLVLPVSYLVFCEYKIVSIPFFLNIILLIIAYAITNVSILKYYFKTFRLSFFYLNVVLKIILVLIASYCISYAVFSQLSEGFLRFVSIVIVNMVSIIVFSFIFIANQNMRHVLFDKLVNCIQYFKCVK